MATGKAAGSGIDVVVSGTAINDVVAAQTLAAGGAGTVFVAGSINGWLFWDGNGDGSLDQAIILNGLNTLGGFEATNLI